MRDRHAMLKALRAAHGIGAAGLLALAVAMALSLPARAAELQTTATAHTFVPDTAQAR